jgi:hypothetical protein
VGFDPGDGLHGAAPDRAEPVIGVDGQVAVRDVDGDRLPGMGPAEGDFLPGDHHHAAVGGPALDPSRPVRQLGWWAGRAGRAQPQDPGRGSGLGRVRSRCRVSGSKNISV